MLFSVNVLFEKAAGTDIEVPVLEKMSEEEEEKKLLDDVGRGVIDSSQAEGASKVSYFCCLLLLFLLLLLLFYMRLRLGPQYLLYNQLILMLVTSIDHVNAFSRVSVILKLIICFTTDPQSQPIALLMS